MKYKLTIPFRNWKVGSILEEFEYRRLPQEKKKYAIPVNNGVGSIIQTIIRSKILKKN